MVENQIKPIVKPRRKLWGVLNFVILVCFLLICAGLYVAFYGNGSNSELEKMRTELEKKHSIFGLYLSPNLTEKQMSTIDDILMKMVPIKKDSLWMSQFEFTTGQWNGILDKECNPEQKAIPMTDVSFGDIYLFIDSLANMTNINFALPSSEEWIYAAHGGNKKESFLYVGDDDVNKVAWYKDNSDGHVHSSDGLQGKDPNILDLYDMSGNVSELCNSPFDDSGLYTICGGNFGSPSSEVTADSQKGFATDAKDKTVGFRLIIRKE